MYRQIVDGIIDRSGNKCTINIGSEQIETHAFITPQKIDNKELAGEVYSEAGVFNERRYLYVGKAEHDLRPVEKECVIESGGRKYFVDHAEMYEVAREEIYCRAVLREKLDGDDGWTS